MGKPGFCIEFFAEVTPTETYAAAKIRMRGGEATPTRQERFRVYVANGRVETYMAFTDGIGEMAWARVLGDLYFPSGVEASATAPLDENRIIASALAAHLVSPAKSITKSANGTLIIDLGFLEREP